MGFHANHIFWYSLTITAIQFYAWRKWPKSRTFIAVLLVLSGLDSLATLTTSDEPQTLLFLGSQLGWIAIGMTGAAWLAGRYKAGAQGRRNARAKLAWWPNLLAVGRFEVEALRNYGDVYRAHLITEGSCTGVNVGEVRGEFVLCDIIINATVSTTITTTKGTYNYGPYHRDGLTVQIAVPLDGTAEETRSLLRRKLVGHSVVTGEIEGVHRSPDGFRYCFDNVDGHGTIMKFETQK